MMPDHAQMVARAASLVPTLRMRGAEAEQFRRLPDANIAELRAAGLFKVLQPSSLSDWSLADPAIQCLVALSQVATPGCVRSGGGWVEEIGGVARAAAVSV